MLNLSNLSILFISVDAYVSVGWVCCSKAWEGTKYILQRLLFQRLLFPFFPLFWRSHSKLSFRHIAGSQIPKCPSNECNQEKRVNSEKRVDFLAVKTSKNELNKGMLIEGVKNGAFKAKLNEDAKTCKS